MDERIMIAMLALVANALLGGPPWLIAQLQLNKPARMMASFVRMVERKLNRERRLPAARRRRGLMVMLAVGGSGLAAGIALHWVNSHGYYGSLIELIILALCLGVRQTTDLAAAMARSFAGGKIEEARGLLHGTVWRNAALLDGRGLVRASIETVAAQSVSRLAIPLCFYVLFSVPGLLAARALTLLAEHLAQPQDHFATPTMRMYGYLAFIPSLMAGLIAIAAGAVLPFGRPYAGWRAWVLSAPDLFPHRRDVAVNGAVLGAMLGGPASEYAPGPWLGGNGLVMPRDAHRAALLLWTQALMWLLLLGLLRVV